MAGQGQTSAPITKHDRNSLDLYLKHMQKNYEEWVGAMACLKFQFHKADTGDPPEQGG